MRLATWNVNSLTARMPRVTQWIEENEPDVLCLQETKQADDKFPAEGILDAGLRVGALRGRALERGRAAQPGRGR